ncbi:CoA-transferase [Paenibacillus puerhi]|uniref:CoA-transferase n=1 Tax=Paenibacillus puerhi TaxID=2692622 RepID=UPI00135A3A40|nr:CoA-transferase [Paenibacillus puerhi]
MTSPEVYGQEEWLICLLARQLRDGEVIGVGNHSPIPAAAALLAQALHAPGATAYILGQPDWPFEGTKEFFDCMQRGGIDVFFLSGAQIDAWGNINLHVIGDYDRPKVRLPGGAGSGVVAYVCRRILLFKTDHGPKGFPEKLDFVSSAAYSAPQMFRRGRVEGVFTPLGVLRPADAAAEPPALAADGSTCAAGRRQSRLRLAAVAPGVQPAEVQAQTGFDLGLHAFGGREDRAEAPGRMDGDAAERAGLGIERLEPPTGLELELLRTVVRAQLERIYPIFARQSLR